jgi:hypothetical protein
MHKSCRQIIKLIYSAAALAKFASSTILGRMAPRSQSDAPRLATFLCDQQEVLNALLNG